MAVVGRLCSGLIQAPWLALVAVALVVSGCQSVPGHVDGATREYPRGRFMTAEGWGPDEKAAVRDARAELSKMIGVRIRDEFLAVLESTRRGALRDNIEQITQKTVELSENDLVATGIARSWYDADKKSQGALVVLDRSAAGPVYATRIRSAVDQCLLLLEAARGREKAGDYGLALQNDLEALTHVQMAVKLQLAGMVVCPWMSEEFQDMVETPALVQAKDHVRGILGGLQLIKVAGDHQRTYPGRGLREPLVVRLSARDHDEFLSGFPLEFSPGDGLTTRTVTDWEGKAECHLDKLPPSTAAANTVVARADMESMAAGADLSQLTPPQVEFIYYLPTRLNTHLAVFVQDDVASDTVKAVVSANGFQLVEESSIMALVTKHQLSSDADEAELLRAFSELGPSIGPKGFLFIVAGALDEVAIETQETTFGDLHIARVPYSFRLIDASAPSEKKTVLVVTGKGVEAYIGDPKEATRRARIVCAKEVSGKLLHDLADRLRRE